MTTQDHLKEMRESTGLTQAELAHRSGVSITTISRHERAKTWPRANDQRALRAAIAAALAEAGAK